MFAILIAGLLTAPKAAAQDPDTLLLPAWESNLTAKFNISQASYHNWIEGGINALASTALVDGKFVRHAEAWTHTYESRLSFGVIKQDRETLRKSEDLIRLRATINYVGDGFFHTFTPSLSAGFRTQFAPGFNYEENPFNNNWPLPVKVSDLFSPATFSQSLGLEYASEWGFKQRLGMGAKETVVLIELFRPLYGLDSTETVRFQLGVESYTEIDKEIFKNVRLKSMLGLFAAFNQEEFPDLIWENLIVMKVNSWLSADFEFVTMFDRDISDALQIKESLSVGISVIII